MEKRNDSWWRNRDQPHADASILDTYLKREVRKTDFLILGCIVACMSMVGIILPYVIAFCIGYVCCAVGLDNILRYLILSCQFLLSSTKQQPSQVHHEGSFERREYSNDRSGFASTKRQLAQTSRPPRKQVIDDDEEDDDQYPRSRRPQRRPNEDDDVIYLPRSSRVTSTQTNNDNTSFNVSKQRYPMITYK